MYQLKSIRKNFIKFGIFVKSEKAEIEDFD